MTMAFGGVVPLLSMLVPLEVLFKVSTLSFMHNYAKSCTCLHTMHALLIAMVCESPI